MKKIKEITIIGPGLIGASLGLALKKNKVVNKINGIDTNKDNIKSAIKIKAIDYDLKKIDQKIAKSNLIILCTPVGKFKSIIRLLEPYITDNNVVTDVGSVKNIFKKKNMILTKKKLDIVPAHPIAGTEFSGALNAKDDLFNNKWCILTPLKKSKNLKLVKFMWESVGMKVSLMSPEEHDEIMSVTSHLPHLIAFTIVSTAFNLNPKEKKRLLNFSAGGFRDFTRIGSSDPEMWKDIFLNNKKYILKTLTKFINDLGSFKSLIENDEATKIYKFIKKTKSIRKKIITLDQS